ncbi:MAG TPA: single-stranded-DNA-specific exonuclease RecJ [Gaiellaceae bacterium]|jgi:single-stranded-DNA-specific exonuclease
MQQGKWTISRADWHEVRSLASALELSELTAAVLIRRGLAEPEQARAFLAAEAPGHDAFALGDMTQAVERIRAAVGAGEKICVHGDYDVDGVAATALAVLLLRELGAEVCWALPSRFDEGYGLTPGMLERLAGDGCSLVITVDCGITAVDEVAKAAELGLEVIVTDHHRPGERLPDCPIVAPRPSDYPFAGLCGTGVVYKLGEALFGADSEFLRDQLDLVCLATVADVVPLVDENRWLVAAGLKKLGRTTRPGLRALMRAAGVDAATIETGQIGFRLAPRINAAGRLGHPDLALELLLGEDEEEASRQARKLEELNRERQVVEDGILRAAVQEVESWPETKRSRRAYVIAGEDWNEGVIGIVASRLVERFSRPVVLVAGSGGDWKGSGRSIPAFDLHSGIVACSSLLERFGGHRAAAGFSIRPENLEQFSEAFTAYASEALSDADLVSVTKVDAIVPPQTKLTLELCQELEQLAPFGLGNPGVLLLTSGCELSDLASCGDGKHLRFRVSSGGCDAGGAIAFGMGKQIDRLRRGGHYDLAFRLEANRWNGTVTPQLQVRRIFDEAPRYEELRDHLVASWREGESSWDEQTRTIFTEAGLLEDGAGRRNLLESETFRALVAGEESVIAAA